MHIFKGFSDQESFTSLPNSFFTHLLEEMEDIDELKVILHTLWCIGNMEGPVRFLREQDFATITAEPSPGLKKAVGHGILLGVEHGGEVYYFLNSPRGRLSARALQEGRLTPENLTVTAPQPPRPNAFKLYEENIGPLTPLIADAIRDAEATYSEAWVAEALVIAVEKNKRNWKYVEAILRRWKEEGHAKKQAGRNPQEDGRRYIEGEYADLIEH